MPQVKFLPDRTLDGRAMTGYGGIPLGVTITRNFRRDLEHALETEHGSCGSTACDISEAMSHGYTYVAAHLLLSATDDFRELDRVLAAHRFNGTMPAGFGSHLYDNEDWDGWKQHFDDHARECPSCGTFNFGELADTCDNCLAAL